MIKGTRNFILFSIGTALAVFVCTFIISAILTDMRMNYAAPHNRLDILGTSICKYQRSHHITSGRYAKKKEIEKALDFGSKDFIKSHGKDARIYDLNEEFKRDYPNLPLCVELGVTTDEYKILVVGNIDKDDLPDVSLIYNDCLHERLISDEYDYIIQDCKDHKSK